MPNTDTPEDSRETPSLEGALREVLHGYDQARRALGKSLELGANDLATLQFLMNAGESGPAEIATHLGITSASMTVLLDRLEERKLLRRVPHPTDRRRRLLELTEHATESVLGTLAPLLRAEATHRDEYRTKDQELIAGYLASLAEVYEDFVRSLDAER